MKKFFVLAALALLVSFSLSAQISGGGTAWVSVKSAAVKSSTWFFAGTRGVLQVGAQVSVLRVSGKWAEVRQAGGSLSGWTQAANLSARRVVSSSSSASVSEIALGGKGFSQEVEDAYKAQGALDYAGVDRTEAIVIPQEELYAFFMEGRLVTGEEK